MCQSLLSSVNCFCCCCSPHHPAVKLCLPFDLSQSLRYMLLHYMLPCTLQSYYTAYSTPVFLFITVEHTVTAFSPGILVLYYSKIPKSDFMGLKDESLTYQCLPPMGEIEPLYYKKYFRKHFDVVSAQKQCNLNFSCGDSGYWEKYVLNKVRIFSRVREATFVTSRYYMYVCQLLIYCHF